MDFDLKFEHREPDFVLGLESVRRALPEGDVRAMAQLSGGYCNANYALELASGERCVLRVAGRDAETLAMECALLRHLEGALPVPRVLHVALDGGAIGRPHALLSLLPGVPLCQVEDGLPAATVEDLGRQVGALAAQVHAQRFAGSGFFGTGPSGELTLLEPVPSIRGAYEGLIRRCMASAVLRERLGDARTDALAACFARHGDAVWAGLEQGCLVHSDFNQKNILVAEQDGRWTVTGLLDFEFAHAGVGLDDLGNFLRFAHEQPDYGDALVAGYLEAGGRLPNDWRFRTRYLDLVPMMQMLARERFGPRGIATTRSVIEANLKALASDAA